MAIQTMLPSFQDCITQHTSNCAPALLNIAGHHASMMRTKGRRKIHSFHYKREPSSLLLPLRLPREKPVASLQTANFKAFFAVDCATLESESHKSNSQRLQGTPRKSEGFVTSMITQSDPEVPLQRAIVIKKQLEFCI